MSNSSLDRLVYKTLNNYYRTHVEDWKTHVASPAVWLDLVCLYKNELFLLGYNLDGFTFKTMDEELERIVVYGNGSLIGMDWEKDDDGFEGFHYWIEE